MKPSFILICCCSVLNTAVSASHWQENLEGRLQAVTLPAQPLSRCESTAAGDNYASRVMDSSTGRVRLTAQGFAVTGQPDALLISPYRPAEDNTVLVPTYWSWQQQAQDPTRHQLFWADPATARLRSVQIKLPALQWLSRWAVPYQPQTHPWLDSSVQSRKLADDPSADWLILPGDERSPVRLFATDSGIPRQFPVSVAPATYAVLPQPADLDLDGLAERLYVLNTAGVLMQYSWTASAGWQATQVADLQSSGWQFDGSLQHFSARWRGAEGWGNGEVFLMLVRATDQYRLVVLRRQDGANQVIKLSDLGEAGSGQVAGWQLPLPGRPVSVAKVLAGILYLPLQTGPYCAAAPAYDQLLVTQLYQGAAVNGGRFVELATAVTSPLRLRAGPQHFQLWSGEQMVIPHLFRLSDRCDGCVEMLRPEHLQGQQQMAWYLPEEVY